MDDAVSLNARIRRRRSRFWLYMPFVLLGVVAAGWSTAWFVVRGRVADGVESWRQREATRGRVWTCPGESIAGYPFRIEYSCAKPMLTWGPQDGRLTATTGAVVFVAQIYEPSHVVLEADGPANIALPGGGTLELNWRDLRASIGGRDNRIDRLSLVVDGSLARLTHADGAVEVAGSKLLDLQMRPNPTRWDADGAADIALTVTGAAIPALDALLQTSDIADIALRAAATQVRELPARNPAESLDAWRDRGGMLEIAALSIAKGDKRLEASGQVGLDPRRRLSGQLDLQAAGLDALVSRLTGGNSRMTSLVIGGLSLLAPRGAKAQGQLPGGGSPDDKPRQSRPGLSPLPTLSFAQGRLLVGPIGLLDLSPLY